MRDIGRRFVGRRHHPRVQLLVEVHHVGDGHRASDLRTHLVDKRGVIAQLRRAVPGHQWIDSLFGGQLLIGGEVDIVVKLEQCERIGVVVADLHRGTACDGNRERGNRSQTSKRTRGIVAHQ